MKDFFTCFFLIHCSMRLIILFCNSMKLFPHVHLVAHNSSKIFFYKIITKLLIDYCHIDQIPHLPLLSFIMFSLIFYLMYQDKSEFQFYPFFSIPPNFM